jgi:hypothetical protein
MELQFGEVAENKQIFVDTSKYFTFLRSQLDDIKVQLASIITSN